MYLKALKIKNFRAITAIDVEFAAGINVIVGPNAVGKTTILEAIRLPKALVAPRTLSEATQTLIQLGAAAPHNPQQLIAEAIAQDVTKPVEIVCGYQLSETELSSLAADMGQLTTQLVLSRVQGAAQSPAGAAAFLSSPGGQEMLAAAGAEVSAAIDAVRGAGGLCRLGVHIDFVASRVTTPEPVQAALIGYLDTKLGPDRTKFSYFPADRALPRGEQPIQLGSPDAGQQLESHNSQPQLKYGRLKNIIFNAIIGSDNGRQLLFSSFESIFTGILKGRELVGAGVSQHGLLSIIIRNTDSGREFDIDAMSSGEKGLLLTLLLMERSLSDESVVLLDEPELHLNPAVCKDLLSFMIDSHVIPKSMQIIICSHSPEILAGAFGREECGLYHLVSGTLLTRVRISDQFQITEALRRLGTSESEGLLYKGTIFVEGEHDVDLLDVGFGSVLKQFKVKDLGGRNEIENQIRKLQEAENAGEDLTTRYFIFDKDKSPTDLVSSDKVRVLQWDRRCLENYLIDLEVITDLINDEEFVPGGAGKSLGEVAQTVKNLAMNHLDNAVLEDVYRQIGMENPGLRPKEVYGKSFDEAADIIWNRLSVIQTQSSDLISGNHKSDFIQKCISRRGELEPVWDANWIELCDGKRLFKEIHTTYQFRISQLRFKKRIMQSLRAAPPRPNWRAIESLLITLIGSTPISD